MKDFLKLLWSSLSDKHTVLVSGVTHLLICVFLVYGAFYIPIYNSETPYQLLHRHAKQWQVFVRDSADNNTMMIGVIDQKFEDKIKFESLKADWRSHERLLYDLVDDNTGEFKSKIKQKIWERREQEIKDEMREMEKRLRQHESQLEAGMMFAQRDR